MHQIASRTVVITGGSGFIGSHLAERLVANGDHVVVLDDLSTGSRENLASVEASCSLSGRLRPPTIFGVVAIE